MGVMRPLASTGTIRALCIVACFMLGHSPIVSSMLVMRDMRRRGTGHPMRAMTAAMRISRMLSVFFHASSIPLAGHR